MPLVPTKAADSDLAGLLGTHWQRTRRMLTNVVAAMPEEKYDFRPVKEVRSFRELALHVIQDGMANTGWAVGISREESEKMAKKYENYKTRDEILRGINEMFDYGDKIMAQVNEQNAQDIVTGMRGERMTRFEAAMVAFEDMTSLYGNFEVYLRLNGVVPPSTVNSEAERMENQRKNKEAGIAPAPVVEGEHQH